MRTRSWIGRGLGEEGRVNVTPLIDVVMCLIVFYLIVGHLVLQKREEDRLPVSAVGREPDASDPLVVTVLSEPGAGGASLLIGDQEVTIERFGSIIAGRVARAPVSRVRLRAGRSFAWSRIDPVVRACREAGVTHLELATEPAS